MKLETANASRHGPAIDARTLDVTPERLRDAIESPTDDLVSCPPPAPVHAHVGLLAPTTTCRRRTALAAAARSRGLTSDRDADRRDVREELAAIEVPAADVPGAVARLAEAAAEVDALRDRVARLGGIVAAREGSADVESARADLRSAAADLAAAETTREAAHQTLERERTRQRAANDARERRLHLRDRLENHRREARRDLAARIAPALERAHDSLPRGSTADETAGFALAVARIAALRAPVIVVDGPFRTAMQARACLDAPVVLASQPA